MLLYLPAEKVWLGAAVLGNAKLSFQGETAALRGLAGTQAAVFGQLLGINPAQAVKVAKLRAELEKGAQPSGCFNCELVWGADPEKKPLQSRR